MPIACALLMRRLPVSASRWSTVSRTPGFAHSDWFEIPRRPSSPILQNLIFGTHRVQGGLAECVYRKLDSARREGGAPAPDPGSVRSALSAPNLPLPRALQPLRELRLSGRVPAQVLRSLHIGHASLLDQAHSLKFELAGKLPSLHDPPPAPSKHPNSVSSEPGAGHFATSFSPLRCP
jgi:hypothetical protein